LGEQRKISFVRSVTAREQRGHVEVEVVAHRHEHRHAPRDARAGLVHREGGHGDDHLFAGRHEGAHQQVDDLARARAEHALLLRRGPRLAARRRRSSRVHRGVGVEVPRVRAAVTAATTRSRGREGALVGHQPRELVAARAGLAVGELKWSSR
jgi:hypothetical protein